MSLGALIVVVAFAVTLLIGVVHYTGGSRTKGGRDHGEVILEFARAYPGEAIRSVTMTKDGNASFLRLADGKTGFIQSMGRHQVARLILPGDVSVQPVEEQPGLHIEFHESTLKGGDYIFASAEDAAEVSLWLCGSFALASPDFDAPEGGENA
ncbi:MAG: hypothetical protein COA37_04520 [Hoeflea sp.]|uniref:hypothetical protein n=1 Tax=Hoeflea sp. TaxID=1940281 RepID=UPI000C0FBB52|nr:hypothetical protein [Hoeflea sp.]PHR25005.1 MAG: hypothetical protein COA37_04520 [Hoeflea sp.]|tara:strand:+ start:191008 stop:191466 length:459 start_codon:yes stop_codon:yes gene_type:complete